MPNHYKKQAGSAGPGIGKKKPKKPAGNSQKQTEKQKALPTKPKRKSFIPNPPPKGTGQRAKEIKKKNPGKPEPAGKGIKDIYKKQPLGMNKSAYALKPVPEGNKGKGLSKLPTEVRNKMGYMMDSSHSFKGKAANNMKTMYMGSVYYEDPEQTENKEIVVGDDGNLKTKTTTIDTVDRVEDVFSDVKEKSQGSFSDVYNKFEKVNGKAKNPRTGKLYNNLDEFIKDAKANPAGTTKQKTGTRVVQDQVEKVNMDDIGQSFQSTGNFGRRQQMRGAIQGERKAKRTAIRQAKAAAARSGLKGKAKRDFMREQKGIAKGIQFENQSNRIAEINRQTAMQEAQGIIGPGKDIQQGFTPGTMKGNYDIRKDSRQKMNRGVSDFSFKSNLSKDDIKIDKPKANLSLTSMKMSPKAMKYFNRKNK